MVVEFTRNDIIKQFQNHLELAQREHNNKNFRDAIEHYFQALPLTKYINEITTGQLKQKIADCYYFLVEFRLAIRYYNEIIDLYRDDLTEKEFIFVLIRKGVALGKLGKYADAIRIFEEVAGFNSNEAKTKAYNNLGILYSYLHKFTERDCLGKAMEYLIKALVIIDENQKSRKFSILHNIGMVYHEQHKYEKAIDTFTSALALTQDPHRQAKTYSEIAKTQIELGNFEEALRLINMAQKIVIKYKDYYEISNILSILGLYYMKKGEISSSHNYLQAAFFGFLEIQAYPEVVQTCLQMNKLFLGIDRSRAEVYYEQYKFYINYVDPLGE